MIASSTRAILFAIAALGAMLLGSEGDWLGVTRRVFSVSAAVVTAATVLIVALGGHFRPSQYRSETVVGLLCVLALGTATVSLNWEHRRHLTNEGPRTDRHFSTIVPEQSDTTCGPSTSAVATSANEPAKTANPDTPKLKRIVDLIQQANDALQLNQHEVVEPLLVKALAEFDTLASPNLKKRGEISLTLAKSRAALGKVDQAVQTLADNIRLLEQKGAEMPEQFAALRQEAGVLLGNAGRFAESLPWFEQSIQQNREIKSSPVVIASTLAKLAISLAKVDRRVAASNALTEARTLLFGEQPDADGLKQLERIAQEYQLDI